jgi:hypothetical protein
VTQAPTPTVGDLVVVPAEPGLGVGRLERIVTVDGREHARVILYDDGRIVLRALTDVARCPPGVWDRKRAT